MSTGKHTPGTHVRKIIDGLALVHRKPRTVQEIAEVTGSKVESTRRWLECAADEGLLTKQPAHHGKNGRAPAVYTWNHLENTNDA